MSSFSVAICGPAVWMISARAGMVIGGCSRCTLNFTSAKRPGTQFACFVRHLDLGAQRARGGVERAGGADDLAGEGAAGHFAEG